MCCPYRKDRLATALCVDSGHEGEAVFLCYSYLERIGCTEVYVAAVPTWLRSGGTEMQSRRSTSHSSSSATQAYILVARRCLDRCLDPAVRNYGSEAIPARTREGVVVFLLCSTNRNIHGAARARGEKH